MAIVVERSAQSKILKAKWLVERDYCDQMKMFGDLIVEVVIRMICYKNEDSLF